MNRRSFLQRSFLTICALSVASKLLTDTCTALVPIEAEASSKLTAALLDEIYQVLSENAQQVWYDMYRAEWYYLASGAYPVASHPKQVKKTNACTSARSATPADSIG